MLGYSVCDAKVGTPLAELRVTVGRLGAARGLSALLYSFAPALRGERGRMPPVARALIHARRRRGSRLGQGQSQVDVGVDGFGALGGPPPPSRASCGCATSARAVVPLGGGSAQLRGRDVARRAASWRDPVARNGVYGRLRGRVRAAARAASRACLARCGVDAPRRAAANAVALHPSNGRPHGARRAGDRDAARSTRTATRTSSSRSCRRRRGRLGRRLERQQGDEERRRATTTTDDAPRVQAAVRGWQEGPPAAAGRDRGAGRAEKPKAAASVTAAGGLPARAGRDVRRARTDVATFRPPLRRAARRRRASR